MKWLYVLQGLLFVKTHPILLLASSLSFFLPFSSIFKKSVLLLGLFACLSLCHLSFIYWAIICPREMHMQSHMKAFFLAFNITQYIRCLSSMNTPFSFTKTKISKTRVHSKKGVFFFFPGLLVVLALPDTICSKLHASRQLTIWILCSSLREDRMFCMTFVPTLSWRSSS